MKVSIIHFWPPTSPANQDGGRLSWEILYEGRHYLDKVTDLSIEAQKNALLDDFPEDRLMAS
jgi:hypothetical protein